MVHPHSPCHHRAFRCNGLTRRRLLRQGAPVHRRRLRSERPSLHACAASSKRALSADGRSRHVTRQCKDASPSSPLIRQLFTTCAVVPSRAMWMVPFTSVRYTCTFAAANRSSTTGRDGRSDCPRAGDDGKLRRHRGQKLVARGGRRAMVPYLEHGRPHEWCGSALSRMRSAAVSASPVRRIEVPP